MKENCSDRKWAPAGKCFQRTSSAIGKLLVERIYFVERIGSVERMSYAPRMISAICTIGLPEFAKMQARACSPVHASSRHPFARALGSVSTPKNSVAKSKNRVFVSIFVVFVQE